LVTVQREHINYAQVRTLLGVNIGFSGFIGLMAICLAPAIAHFYQEPRLLWIAIALVGGTVISGFGAQHAALFQRQMQYSKLPGREILAPLLGAGLPISAAPQDIGYWALAICLSSRNGRCFDAGSCCKLQMVPWQHNGEQRFPQC
jgi:O-antigen/teichoic acid export membrane protein